MSAASRLARTVSRMAGASLRHWYRGVGTCLAYHRVEAGRFRAPEASRFEPNRILSVCAGRFEEQMRYLSRHHRCIDVPTGVEELAAGRLPEGSVMVTFDDGYRDNLRVALPILEKYGVPATVYVSTGFVDGSADFWWAEHEYLISGNDRLTLRWRDRDHAWDLSSVAGKRRAFRELNLMYKSLDVSSQRELTRGLRAAGGRGFSYRGEFLDWDEVRELDRHPLVTIGAHTVNHPPLERLEDAEVEREMTESRRRLEEALGHEVPCLAYPFGGKGEAGLREFETAARLGFRSAFTTRPGHLHAAHRGHLHALPRMMVEYDDTLEDFRFKLSGLDALIQQRGRRFVTG